MNFDGIYQKFCSCHLLTWLPGAGAGAGAGSGSGGSGGAVNKAKTSVFHRDIVCVVDPYCTATHASPESALKCDGGRHKLINFVEKTDQGKMRTML